MVSNDLPMISRKYPSPPLGDGQFRLLSLLPGSLTQSIACTLSIDDIPGAQVEQKNVLQRGSEYEALSYTWGTSSNHVITLNGQHAFPVTNNLFYALKRLKYAHTVRVLWIDAVCINQSDLQERSQQVQHMRSIYREASRVIV